MRQADVGDDDGVRAGDLAQKLDIALASRAHLRDHDLGRGVGAQQRHGQPDLVVERRGARVRPESRRQDRGRQVLGRRLAVRTRDADQAHVGRAPALVPRQIQERAARVGDVDRRPPHPGTMHHRGDRPALECVGDEVVAVQALAGDRDEHGPGRDRARVRGDRVRHAVRTAERPAHGGGDLREPALDHVAAPIARSSSAATPRSSNGIVRSASS
jgi:hypothetical protein